MKKNELLMELRRLTSHLPQEEADRFTQYYSEIISDAMEDGMSEEEAVASVGTIEEISAYIKENNNIQTDLNSKNVGTVENTVNKKKDLPVWAIVLIIIGFPIWFSMLCTAFSMYMTGWAVIIALFAAVLALFVSGIILIPVAVMMQDFALLMVMLGTGIFCIGLSMMGFVGMVKLSQLYVKATIFLANSIAGIFKGDSK